jgi:alpha-glucosidase
MEKPVWWQDGIIYQVYPRSFSDSNRDGIGDLPGVTERLDHLVWLGIDAIWLSPFYPSPDVDFGYDISDHTQVDERFGTLQDFDQLVDQAHQRGLRVMLDLVLNHTSDQHTWFKESRSNRINAKRDWYIWRDDKNNWLSEAGGSGWTFDPHTGQYYYHSYMPEQPDVNWRNPEVREAQLQVVRFWLERGVDGFRLDVFNLCFKDAEFRDNPGKIGLRPFDRFKHIYDSDRPEMMPLLKELRALLDRYPDTYAVGETFMPTSEKSASFVGKELLHATLSFDFLQNRINFPWNPKWLMERIMNREKFFSREKWPTTVMSNHDFPRAAGRYSRTEDDSQAMQAMTLLLTLRGTPYLYYGEEIGMRNLRLRRDQIMDPPGKRYWPIYKGRDGYRSPMQWDDTTYSGFSESKPWLPVHPDHVGRNVREQKENPDSLLHFTRKLIRLRKEYPAITLGDFKPIYVPQRQVMTYVRKHEEQKVLVAMNFSRQKTRVLLGPELSIKNWRALHGGTEEPANKQDLFEIPANGILILVAED